MCPKSKTRDYAYFSYFGCNINLHYQSEAATMMYPFTDYVELLCFQDIGLPKDGDTWEGIKIIFTNISMLIYLIMMFVCGCCYGFVETFLFVYLKVYIYILRKGQDDITNQTLKSNPQGNRKLGIPKAGRSIST